jgi:hypothetical protein
MTPKLKLPPQSKPKPKQNSNITQAAENFQRQADANSGLNLYEHACQKITTLLDHRRQLRDQMTNCKSGSERFWDLKRRMDTLNDQFYYWQGEKRDIMIEKQIAAMDRLTAALEEAD